MSGAIINEFGLTISQMRLMTSLQAMVVETDISFEKDEGMSLRKKRWLNEWKTAILNFLSHSGEGEFIRFCDKEELDRLIEEEKERLGASNSPLHLILLETILFEPFFPLSVEASKEYKGLRFCATFRKEYHNTLEEIAGSLGIDKGLVRTYRKTYKASIDGIRGKKTKMLMGGLAGAALAVLTAGYAIPVIGVLFAPAGLYGAAAVNAGLAALGGGALAVGGFGVAGGMAVIAGGGGILAAGIGTGLGRLFIGSPTFALTQAAKLEVVLKEIVLGQQRDVRFAQELIKEQRHAINRLEEEMLVFRSNEDKHKTEIANLKKSIAHLRKSLMRNENAFAEGMK